MKDPTPIQRYHAEQMEARPPSMRRGENRYPVLAVECQDGFCMSVQAGAFNQCSPKADLTDGRYRQWEVGYPSSPCPELQDTVTGYVDTEIVDAILERHGGIKGPMTVQRWQQTVPAGERESGQ